MSLFRDLGERFEETKQAFVDGTEAAYVCGSCEASVAEDYTYCPHCGEEAVESVE